VHAFGQGRGLKLCTACHTVPKPMQQAYTWRCGQLHADRGRHARMTSSMCMSHPCSARAWHCFTHACAVAATEPGADQSHQGGSPLAPCSRQRTRVADAAELLQRCQGGVGGAGGRIGCRSISRDVPAQPVRQSWWRLQPLRPQQRGADAPMRIHALHGPHQTTHLAVHLT